MLKKLLLSLIILSMSLLLFAQTANSASTMSSSSAYSYDGNRSGVEKLKMNVYILGRVSKPGLYLVPDDTDFLTLLALAGGPLEDAKLSRKRITLIRTRASFSGHHFSQRRLSVCSSKQYAREVGQCCYRD